jgi:hypothetical protein
VRAAVAAVAVAPLARHGGRALALALAVAIAVAVPTLAALAALEVEREAQPRVFGAEPLQLRLEQRQGRRECARA